MGITNNSRDQDGPVVRVLELIHEDIQGLRVSQDQMSKTLIQFSAQELAPRIKSLEEKAHQFDVALAALDPTNVKKRISELHEGQVKLMIKMATIGGGAGLAGGGLLYWVLQMMQATP